MKIVVTSTGTRGDVQPSVALACALKEKGHEVIVLTNENYQTFVESFGLKFAKLSGNPEEIMKSKAVQQSLATGNMVELMKQTAAQFQADEAAAKIDYQTFLESEPGIDAVVPSQTMFDKAWSCAEKFSHIPVVGVTYVPYYMPTKQFGNLLTYTFKTAKDFAKSKEELEAEYYGSYEMMYKMMAPASLGRINEWREKMGVAPINNECGIIGHWRDVLKKPIIHAFSPVAIGGVPQEYEDNKDYMLFSGYFTLPTDERDQKTLSPELEAFLNKGEAPVFLGFGSMPAPEPKKLVDLAVALTEKLGCRTVLAAGWTNLFTPESATSTSAVPSSVEAAEADEQLLQTLKRHENDILLIREAPYTQLFPRCKCIVHHGGAGTTGSALASGTPQVVVHFMMDQPFWGWIMHSLGVASEPIMFKDVNPDNLATAVSYCLKEPTVQEKAKALGAKVQAEGNGVWKAVQLIEAEIKKK